MLGFKKRLRRKDKIGFLRRIVFSQISIAVFGFIVLALISIPLARNVSKEYYVQKEVKELEAEIAAMETKNKELRGLINYLESDQFVETEARLNLNLMKDGENILVINDDMSTVTESELGDSRYSIEGFKNEIPAKEAVNPIKWWKYFFGA